MTEQNGMRETAGGAAQEGPPSAEAPPPQAPPARAPDETRKAKLAQHVANAVATQGARVESQSDFQAVLVTGQKVNHVLHLLITLFTCGIWAIVWLLLVVTGGEKRHIIQVDEWGQILTQHVQGP